MLRDDCMANDDVIRQTDDSDSSKSGALELRNLSVGYDEPLISDINMEISQGETIAILGPSGIGKTTLLRTIAGLIRSLDGEVIHDFPVEVALDISPKDLD